MTKTEKTLFILISLIALAVAFQAVTLMQLIKLVEVITGQVNILVELSI